MVEPSLPIFYRPRAEVIPEQYRRLPIIVRPQRREKHAQSGIEQYGAGNQNLQGNIQQINWGRKKGKRRSALTQPMIVSPASRSNQVHLRDCHLTFRRHS